MLNKFFNKRGGVFVIINTVSNFVLILRSIVFLQFLPDSDLGFLLLFQSIIMLFNLVHFGIFNGGLRIFSIDSEKSIHQRTNDTIFSTSILITLIIFCFGSLYYTFHTFDYLVFLISILTGGLLLLKNWFNNLLIAKKELRKVNLLTASSSGISVIISFSVKYIGVWGAIYSLSSLYLSYIIFFIVICSKYLPKKIDIEFVIIRKLLKYGFVPYLTGVAFLLNNQIDRFFIVEILSYKDLGKLYLATTFFTVFNMLPKNLNSLYTPIAINEYEKRNLSNTINTSKKLFLIIFIYCLFTLLSLLSVGDEVVKFVFPDKIEQLRYLFILLPGVFALALSKPLSFILYAALDLKVLFISNLFSLLVYIIILIMLMFFNMFTIENVTYGKTLQGLLVLVFLSISTIFRWTKIKSFYFIEKDKS